ncbi:MAG: PepSY-like domain-containing protein [Bacteroidales bacterium]|nr:PepSY-like domain-containing protein [Bacteroidales bacterium]
MKLTLLALALGLASVTTTVAQQPVTLPATAQQFISKHHSKAKVSHVQRDREDGQRTYEVFFENGDYIEFDAKGQWLEIKCRGSQVPASIMPTAMTQHLKAQHPNARVVKIERERRYLVVELANGIELIYDRNGNFKRYDD